jgi:hypothetical protein
MGATQVSASKSMGEICAEVLTAASTILKQYDIKQPSIVVNIVWKDSGDPTTYAVGTAVPRRYRKTMAESLAQSLEEAS